MKSLWVCAIALAVSLSVMPQDLSANNVSRQEPLTLETIMAHPDWIGNAPENPYLSLDSSQVFYSRKATGSSLTELWQVGVDGSTPKKLSLAESVMVEPAQRVYSQDKNRVAWLSQGDVYVQTGNQVAQRTRTGTAGRLLGFIENHSVALLQDKKIVSLRLADGFLSTLAEIVLADEPKDVSADDYLSQQQLRLFDILKKRAASQKEQAEQREQLRALAQTSAKPFYFGAGKTVETVSLSPNGRYLLVGLSPEKRDGKADKMPHYVAKDGYVNIEDVRSKVGTDKPTEESVYVLDLHTREKTVLLVDNLPGVQEDPLFSLKKAVAKAKGEKLEKEKKNRAVYIQHWPTGGVKWSNDGSQVAVHLRSYDNKDRWLASVDFVKSQWRVLHHLHDSAWVNDSEFNEFGWLNNGEKFWYTSEESGYSHLYLVSGRAKAKALTSGKFEVNRVSATDDEQWLYYRANKAHPGNHEVFRVNVNDAKDEPVTALGGDNEYVLAPNNKGVVVTHSTTTRPPELYWQPIAGAPVQLTQTVSSAFSSRNWLAPEIIAVPSSHGKDPIYARVYRNKNTGSTTKSPAVMFVHGAGYLQNAHMGWSGYFREYMFHNLLVEQGYVVIDMDYRASEGYGRDWRTAIYQRMGTPELEDYLDGVEWLVKEANVDRERIGIYGGSYGGFMAFMALFKTPDVFAAGAALRPVTDWAHYNHGYTSNILNTPDVDPDAYARSSPIEFAAGLKRPLLICTGMLDDNVFFQDSVRLVQRLIELKKENFEMAVYPIEPHGFREPESWLDEYRRIYKLMENEVKNRRPSQP